MTQGSPTARPSTGAPILSFDAGDPNRDGNAPAIDLSCLRLHLPKSPLLPSVRPALSSAIATSAPLQRPPRAFGLPFQYPQFLKRVRHLTPPFHWDE
jgi:hypothetical protein